VKCSPAVGAATAPRRLAKLLIADFICVRAVVRAGLIYGGSGVCPIASRTSSKFSNSFQNERCGPSTVVSKLPPLKAERNFLARRQTTRRTRERSPSLRLDFTNQKSSTLRARFWLCCAGRGKNLCVIENDDVALLRKIICTVCQKTFTMRL